MTCNEIQELFGSYFDAPENDPIREKVNRHNAVCPDCAAEFEIWEESALLIRSVKEEGNMPVQVSPISNLVMSRIYEDESWRMPIADRIYSIPYKLRRNLTAVIAFCLALFFFSFLYSITSDKTTEASAYGFIPAASASGKISDTSSNMMYVPKAALASATLIKPMKVAMIQSTPDYFLALSLLGMISALLIMNWFTRTRS